MAQVIQLAKPDAEASMLGGFVMTECARDILRRLQLVGTISDGGIALISAAPGTGKTKAVVSRKWWKLDGGVISG